MANARAWWWKVPVNPSSVRVAHLGTGSQVGFELRLAGQRATVSCSPDLAFLRRCFRTPHIRPSWPLTLIEPSTNRENEQGGGKGDNDCNGKRFDGKAQRTIANEMLVRICHASIVAREASGFVATCAIRSGYRGLRASAPRNLAFEPSSCSIRSSWLYFATRSLLAGAPVLI
jgi:hypothetical protein